MPTVLRVRKGVKIAEGRLADLATLPAREEGLEIRVALIQAVIPLALQAVEELLQQEVQALVGARYARGQRPPGLHRWTRQAGSIYLADQKLAVMKPRIRNRHTRQEVPLQTYVRLQQPRAADEGVLRRILHGLSCRLCINGFRVAAVAGRAACSLRCAPAVTLSLDAGRRLTCGRRAGMPPAHGLRTSGPNRAESK